jgi:hypothetical protein
MTNAAIIELEARGVLYSSTYDEDAFFEWLDKLPCVKEYIGQGDTLIISITKSAVDEYALRELLALFDRYNVDMKQLCVFDCCEFAGWFRDSRSYWFESVFGKQAM